MKRKTVQRCSLLLLLLVAGLLLGARTAHVQQPPVRIEIAETNEDDTPFVQDDDFPRVQLDVIPVSNQGAPLHLLPADAFSLVEADQPVPNLTVTPFVNEAQSVSLLLLLDAGATMRDDLAEVRAALIALYDDSLRQNDESALLAFAQLADGRGVDLGEPFPRLDPAWEIEFGSDEGARINLLNGLSIGDDAGSPLYDAVVKGVRMTAAQARYGRRAVVLITDGGDVTADGRSPASNAANAELAAAEAQQLGVPVFTVAIGGQADTAFLARLADDSGGAFMAVDSSNQVGFVLAQIVARLKHAYRLQYTSQLPPDGQTHDLRVGVQVGGSAADTLVALRAYPPRIPQVQELWAIPARAPTAVPLASLPAVRGAVTIEPQIAVRGRVMAVNYYVNDSGTAAYSATAPPWSFYWDTSTLPPDETHTLFIEVVSGDDLRTAGAYETAVFVAACNFFCRTQQQVGLTAVHFFSGGVLLLVVILLLLLRERAGVISPAGAPHTPQRVHYEPEDAGAAVRFPPPWTPPAGNTEVLAAPPPAALAFLLDPQTGELHPVDEEFSVGSGADDDLRVQGKNIGSGHLRISLIDDTYVLLAVNQAHVTRVNQQPVLRHELQHDDHIEIGDYKLVFKRVGGIGNW